MDKIPYFFFSFFLHLQSKLSFDEEKRKNGFQPRIRISVFHNGKEKTETKVLRENTRICWRIFFMLVRLIEGYKTACGSKRSKIYIAYGILIFNNRKGEKLSGIHIAPHAYWTYKDANYRRGEEMYKWQKCDSKVENMNLLLSWHT